MAPASPHPSVESDGEEAKDRRLTEFINTDLRWQPLPWVDDPGCDLDYPLPPGLLPEGLRALMLNQGYNQTLLPASLPSTLTFLQLGQYFDQIIALGVLPASLVYLSVQGSMGDHLAKLLASLPASLERLSLSRWPHHLQVRTLPRGLKALHVVLHSSLLYLSIASLDQLILPNVLPSSLVELHLRGNLDDENCPLPPGMVPSCLRRLTLGCSFSQPPRVGSLPEGLLFLRLQQRLEDAWLLLPLRPRVPSTLRSVDSTYRDLHPLPAGIIPSSVQWVCLWRRYRVEHIEAVLPTHAEVRWYSTPGESDGESEDDDD